MQQVHGRGDLRLSEPEYFAIIRGKTAELTAVSCRLGAHYAGASAATVEAMEGYGRDLGVAFQIADDVLDYTADAEALGKNLGDDLAEGKATLPLIHALAHADAGTAGVLRAAILEGDVAAMPAILRAIRAAGSIDYSENRARDHARRAQAALRGLPHSPWLDALHGLARYAVERDR